MKRVRQGASERERERERERMRDRDRETERERESECLISKGRSTHMFLFYPLVGQLDTVLHALAGMRSQVYNQHILIEEATPLAQKKP